MGALKALGPNDFLATLFQKYWHILGAKVVEALQGMFQVWKLISKLNEAIIRLIPKGD